MRFTIERESEEDRSCSWVYDLNDLDVPYQNGVRLVQGWPGAELMTTSGLGHRKILRAPEVVKRAVEFLSADADSSGIYSIKNRLKNESTKGNFKTKREDLLSVCSS